MDLSPFLNFLLLLMSADADINVSYGTMNSFVEDAIKTFQLKNPTLIYEEDEAPEICLAQQWVLQDDDACPEADAECADPFGHGFTLG